MAIPSSREMTMHILRYADAGQIGFSEIVDKICTDFKLTDEEKRRTISSGSTLAVKNRINRAAGDLVRAGLLNRPRRAQFTLSEKGKKLLSQNPTRIPTNALKVPE